MSSAVEDISSSTTEVNTPPTPPNEPVDHVVPFGSAFGHPRKLMSFDTTSRSPIETSIHGAAHDSWAVFDDDQHVTDYPTPKSDFSETPRAGGRSVGSAWDGQNENNFSLRASATTENRRSEAPYEKNSRDTSTNLEPQLRRQVSPIISEHATESKNGPFSGSKSYIAPADTANAQHAGPLNTPGLNLRRQSHQSSTNSKRPRNLTVNVVNDDAVDHTTSPFGETRPPRLPRALSTPATVRSPSVTVVQEQRISRAGSRSEVPRKMVDSMPQSVPATPLDIPLPPLSLSTCLQLELSSHRPSPMYIQRNVSSDFPYESSAVKIERLLNFLLLPFHFEGVMWFGVLGCLDAWLYVFTVLPLRMLKSIYILCESWYWNINKEVRFVLGFVYLGIRRVWSRRQTHQDNPTAPAQMPVADSEVKSQARPTHSRARSGRHHRRTKSTPSNLLPDDKADILKGLLIICTCLVLLRLDASRMYHWVRGQAAIKLYVIYNLLEVCDRQLSAIGQDVLECLFSQETLERKPNGHSKVLRPFWLFLLAWLYCVIHATALFYQVITMNVAVNSYSSALITLLMSNQFTEIKSTIFKKFEKENLFQLTCADIVERFQLWHMLMIIASRNIVETGALNNDVSSLMASAASKTAPAIANLTSAVPPRSASSVLPKSFMIVPEMLSSITSFAPTVAHVLGPFVIVLGSEMVIDWLKHSYVNKFNNTKPVLYDRFLDVLAKDYYVNAFGNQNLVKRLGLPVIPLSCLMIRAGFQTYQMLLASWVPGPSVSSSKTSLADIHHHYVTSHAAPTSTAGLLVRKMDNFLDALPITISSSTVTSYLTVTLVVLLLFLILLVIKLLLGMALLFVSRSRYQAYRKREQNPSWHIEGGKRIGGWGTIEVDDEKKKWFYKDDAPGYNAMKQREAKDKAKKDKDKDDGYGIQGLEKVMRYEMVAKRIW